MASTICRRTITRTVLRSARISVSSSPSLASAAFSTSSRSLARKQQTGGYRREDIDFAQLTGDLQTDGVHRYELDFLETVQWVKQLLIKMEDDQELLKSKSRPYTPHSSTQPLCFQYSDNTKYDFTKPQPYNTKITMHVKISTLDLTPAQRHQLLLLAGKTYNPYLDVVSVSAETSDVARTGDATKDREINKAQLREEFLRMLDEAKSGKDSFTDVPLDMRHLKVRRSGLEFPEQWLRPKTTSTAEASRS
ncbi:mitochondrial ribosomal subunit protein-domain-containing protein [Powellomyces hirtus]|nr:mitochondrial ribosomal subunit protein-domain-containing protein [Powellomyces hirtus]